MGTRPEETAWSTECASGRIPAQKRKLYGGAANRYALNKGPIRSLPESETLNTDGTGGKTTFLPMKICRRAAGAESSTQAEGQRGLSIAKVRGACRIRHAAKDRLGSPAVLTEWKGVTVRRQKDAEKRAFRSKTARNVQNASRRDACLPDLMEGPKRCSVRSVPAHAGQKSSERSIQSGEQMRAWNWWAAAELRPALDDDPCSSR